MYIVTVIFEVAPENADAFKKRMLQQANDSLTLEPGCNQFDVCLAADNPGKCFLYEKYDDRVAFDTHLASHHFQDFDETVKPWIVSKEVNTWIKD